MSPLIAGHVVPTSLAGSVATFIPWQAVPIPFAGSAAALTSYSVPVVSSEAATVAYGSRGPTLLPFARSLALMRSSNAVCRSEVDGPPPLSEGTALGKLAGTYS